MLNDELTFSSAFFVVHAPTVVVIIVKCLILCLQNAIIIAEGMPPVTEYHSTIYYHTNKPRWNEMFKVCVV